MHAVVGLAEGEGVVTVGLVGVREGTDLVDGHVDGLVGHVGVTGLVVNGIDRCEGVGRRVGRRVGRKVGESWLWV